MMIDLLEDTTFLKKQFEDRCMSLSQGVVPVISKNQIICHLKSFEQISEIFLSLDLAYKQQIKKKYAL